MKAHYLANLSFASMLLSMLCSPVLAAAQQEAVPIVIGERLSIESQILGETRSVIVGTPDGYQSGVDRYPVLYLLDGDSHFHHTTGSTRFLARNGRMPGVIVVAIPNTARTRDLTPPSQDQEEIDRLPTHGGADTFLRFIGEELAPWVEQNYRTRPYRILVGHSLGGLFAVHALTTQPDLFDAYIAISPSLQWNDQGLIPKAEAFFEGTTELKKELFITAGNEGGRLLGGVRKLAGVLGEVAPRGLRWDVDLMPEESHGSVPHESTYKGLEAIFRGWDLPNPLEMYDERGFEALEDAFARGGTRFGYDRKLPARLVGELAFRLVSSGRLEDGAAIMLRDPDAYRPPSFVLNLVAAEYAKAGDAERAMEHYAISLRIHPGVQATRTALDEGGRDVSSLLPQVEVPLEALSSYVGRYQLNPSTVIEVAMNEEGRLSFRTSPEGPRRELIPLSQNRFYRVGSENQYVFTVSEAGEVVALTLDQSPFGSRKAPRVR